MRPVMGNRYLLRELLALELTDSPNLSFIYPVGGKWQVVQNSHLTDEQLLSVPGMAETEWRYLRTTREEIPCFVHVGGVPIEDCVDIEPEPVTEEFGTYWVTPKGFPRDNPSKWEPCENCGYYFCNCPK